MVVLAAAVAALGTVQKEEDRPSPLDIVVDAALDLASIDLAGETVLYVQDLVDAAVLDTASLRMRATGFRPGEACAVCAPTRGGDTTRGVVHDPIARRLGGVAGNAGLFSTAHDLGRFAAMLASGGSLEGVRIFKEETVRMFLRQQPKSG